MTMRSSVRDAMLAAVPSLRAFAISLCGNVDRADDLVQETLLRAMANIDSFQPGTNMSAWLFTILRNLFRSEYRKRRREVEDTDGSYAESLKSHPEQHSRVEFEEFRVALSKLPSDQREALILVGASGFSYEEAAAICDCAVGTIKSRVNRARTRLSDLLSIDGADDFGPDHTTRAILSAGGGGQSNSRLFGAGLHSRQAISSRPVKNPGERPRRPGNPEAPSRNRRRTAAEEADNGRDHEQDDRNKEDDFCDLDREARDPTKAEDGRNQRNNEKRQSPTKHGGAPSFIKVCAARS